MRLFFRASFFRIVFKMISILKKFKQRRHWVWAIWLKDLSANAYIMHVSPTICKQDDIVPYFIDKGDII